MGNSKKSVKLCPYIATLSSGQNDTDESGSSGINNYKV